MISDSLDTSPPTDDPVHTQAPVAVLLGFLSLVYLVGLAVALVSFDYNVWGGMIVATILAIFSWTLIIRFTRFDTDPTIRRFLLAAVTVKQIGTLVRYWVVVEVTGGDALAYHKAGVAIAPFIRAQDFGAPEFAQWVPEIRGTTVIRIIAGIVYNLFGTSRLGGFMVFSFLAFWGMYLMYRAFQMAVPEGRHRRYALLLFLSPTFLFWPSSLGKDAWMVFTIGIVVYGAVRVTLLAPGGYVLVGIGLAGSAIVRVHITVILLAAVVLAGLAGRNRRHEAGRFRGVVRGTVTIVFMAIAITFTVSRAQAFFDEIADGSAIGVLDETVRRSSTGGSEFTPARVTSPTGFPVAVMTVLYRPFPNEANSFAARLTSLEGVMLMVLTLGSGRRLLRLPKHIRASPLVGLATIYSGLFIIAFSTLGNFGILARQRSQLYPVIFILLALPKVQKKLSRRDAAAEAERRSDEALDEEPTSRTLPELTATSRSLGEHSAITS